MTEGGARPRRKKQGNESPSNDQKRERDRDRRRKPQGAGDRPDRREGRGRPERRQSRDRRDHRPRQRPDPNVPSPGITITIKGPAPGLKLDEDAEALNAFQLFRTITGVDPKDLYQGPDRTIYIVTQESFQQVLAGSKRAKRELLKERLGHPVEIIPDGEDAETFAANLFDAFKPEKIERIEAPAGTIIHVSLPIDNKGRAIGKEGSRLRAVRELAARLHDVNDLVVT